MREQRTPPPKTDLERARERFEAWRKTKEYSCTRIPETLWQETVKLAETHSIGEIARTLRLDFGAVKKRVESASARLPAHPSHAPEFVALDFSAMSPTPECVIELERPGGVKMRMSIQGALSSHLVDLAKAFWEVP